MRGKRKKLKIFKKKAAVCQNCGNTLNIEIEKTILEHFKIVFYLC